MKPFKNIERKEDNADYMHFLLFQQSILLDLKTLKFESCSSMYTD